MFFDEQIPEEQILVAGGIIRSWGGVRKVNCVSATQARENFKARYSEGMEELAEGFADDNPLSGSTSCEVFLNELGDQDEIVKRLDAMGGVHKAYYSSAVVAGFTNVGRTIGTLSIMITGMPLAAATFLISNTISMAALFRRYENEIIRHTGTTNYMIRVPFVVERVPLGTLGVAVPLAGMHLLYRGAVVYVDKRYQTTTGFFQPIALEEIFPYMVDATGVLGVRIGFFVSFITIHRYLKV